ncbi:MAG: FAD-dependent oxidoreductase [Candidatus Pacebacteria bacterium]|nr:FAD-dependent oxidoreductase [Candidatus Paceibacterota bacterium]
MLKERSIPLDDSWDVIVVGGGPAGCTAATAAAREGARTLLLEATGMLGGMGTAGLVPWFCGYSDGKNIIARGLAEHVRCTLRDNMPHLKKAMKEHPLIAPAIDPELLKRIYDEMVLDAGAEILFHSQLCAVETSDGNKADTLVVSNKTGLQAYKAKIYVDCTGDGDLAVWAGAPFEKGDETGNLQPGTHCFTIGNIDEELLAQGPQIHFYDPESPVWKAIKSENYPLINELHSCSMKIAPRTFSFNTGHVQGVDNTNPRSTTEGLLKGRQMAAQYSEAFAEYHPAFANAPLVATGSLLGIRETRRIMGDYVLTVEDYLARRDFPDEICRNAYNIDVHESRDESTDLTKLSIPELKERNRKNIQAYGPGESFGVPYRCLIPANLDNVLVAGRCISSDRKTNGSVRIMACCLTTGEAAGIAAAMAAADAMNTRSVNTDELRNKLTSYGAYLPNP